MHAGGIPALLIREKHNDVGSIGLRCGHWRRSLCTTIASYNKHTAHLRQDQLIGCPFI
jgi:hypothetical protein